MKIFIFVFCLIFITIGYTSGADDQIPVEIIEETESPSVQDNDSVIPDVNVEEPTEKLIEKITEKPVDTSRRRVAVQSRRTKPETKITERPPVVKPIERSVEKILEKNVEKPIVKSNPVVDRGSGRFTENVIHSISNGPDDYSFAFKTEEGHNRDESVHIDRNAKSLDDNEDGNVSARGSYSFISADGFEYTVDYVADGKGYRPKVNVRKI